MVAIRVTDQEMLMRTQMQLARVSVERDILDETLNRCAALMTPEQLQQAGLTQPTAEAPVTAVPAEAFAEMVGAGEVVDLPARKSGKAVAQS